MKTAKSTSTNYKIRLIFILASACFFVATTPSIQANALNEKIEFAESECQRIGFKPKTENFAECVLELHSRTKKVQVFSGMKPSERTPEANQCIVMGFVNGTVEFSNCQIQLRQLALQEQQYRTQQNLNDQQSAYLKKQQDLYQAEILLGIANKAFNYAGSFEKPRINTLNKPSPFPPLPLRLTLPSGNAVNCTYVGASYNCR